MESIAIELVKQIDELKEYLKKFAPLKEVEDSLLREGTNKILAKPVVLEKVIDDAITANADALVKTKKIYTYPKETRQRYARKYYLKNKETILAKNTVAMKTRYGQDEEYREKCREYANNHRKRQKKLLEEAQKIIKANEARKQSVINLLYSPDYFP